MIKIDKVYTDTPLIDEIVRQCKEMIYNGIVLKDQAEAGENETVYSVKQADRYADIISGLDMYEMYTYGYDTLMQIPFMTRELAISYARNPALIPDEIKPQLQQIERQKFLMNYEEQNNYYRRLYGLPDLGDKPIYLTDEQIRKLNIDEFDVGKAIHEMNNNEINILDTYGIIEEIQQQNPTKKYLWHLGEKRINPYTARKAPPFSLLYLPPCDSNEVFEKFTDLINKNRQYILSTLYSEAFKYQSDYYDKFICSMIITQAFIDMIVLSPEYIIRRDLFDMRTIQYVFESQGVEFFPNIPLKYQKRLVKNLNRLIKFKSCDKNLVDIASLFGFEDVGLFKYYILKDPIMLPDGTYKKDTTTDPKTGEEVEDLEANYELKFLKVGFNASADEAIRDPFNFENYDQFVEEDVYWNGTYTPEYVKHTILEHEFNMVISKYIGMEMVYSMTELVFQAVYFINMLVYSVDTSKLVIDIPEFSSTVKYPLIDCFICLFSLGYLYKGLEDNIMYNPVQIMDVLGFNFEVDMDELAAYIKDKGFTPEDLGLDNFIVPENGIYTYKQLIEIYTNNKNIYKHVVHEMTNANDKNIYDIYRKIYQSLFVTKLNFDYFTQYGIKPKTYSQFLSIANSSLYDVILECKILTDEDERKQRISEIINIIVENIYVYLDEDMFNHIFHGIPTASMDYLRQYMFQVLNFFKSYKVDFTHVNIVYKLDDRAHNWISIIDRIYLKHIFSKTDVIPYEDFISLMVELHPEEIIIPKEYLNIEITHWIERILHDRVHIHDRLASLLVHLLYKDYGSPYYDHISEYKHILNKGDWIPTEEHPLDMKVTLSKSDDVKQSDYLFIRYNYDKYEEGEDESNP